MFNRLQMKIIDIKNKISRAKHGYSYRDVWNMYDWFLEVMPPMLTKLRDEGVGVPMEFEDNEEGWKDVLTEMINCLDNMIEDHVLEKFGLYANGVYKNHTVEDIRNVNNFMDKNKDRFFELFSKYFYNLWD